MHDCQLNSFLASLQDEINHILSLIGNILSIDGYYLIPSSYATIFECRTVWKLEDGELTPHSEICWLAKTISEVCVCATGLTT